MTAAPAILVGDGVAVPGEISGELGLGSAAPRSDRLTADLS